MVVNGRIGLSVNEHEREDEGDGEDGREDQTGVERVIRSRRGGHRGRLHGRHFASGHLGYG